MATVMRPEAEVRRIVDENRTLVEWSVNRYLDRHVVAGADREDLVSWGLMGLLSAARAFDPDRGLRFSTLAALAIERSIMRGAMQASNQ
ncbi:MAG TPA: sigma factor, partial [Armatimonadota bacterium]|nr:sigma factor [Armatimonadota bacterium]